MYMCAVALVTSVGSFFGSMWGAIAFVTSFLSGVCAFVITEGANFSSRKKKNNHSKAKTKDNKTVGNENVLEKLKEESFSKDHYKETLKISTTSEKMDAKEQITFQNTAENQNEDEICL